MPARKNRDKTEKTAPKKPGQRAIVSNVREYCSLNFPRFTDRRGRMPSGPLAGIGLETVETAIG
jgi:hypothetical protein